MAISVGVVSSLLKYLRLRHIGLVLCAVLFIALGWWLRGGQVNGLEQDLLRASLRESNIRIEMEMLRSDQAVTLASLARQNAAVSRLAKERTSLIQQREASLSEARRRYTEWLSLTVRYRALVDSGNAEVEAWDWLYLYSQLGH